MTDIQKLHKACIRFVFLWLLTVCIIQVASSQHIVKEFELNLVRTTDSSIHQSIDLSGMTPDDFMAVSLVIEGSKLDKNTISGYLKTSKKYELTPAHEGQELVDRFVSELYFLDKSELGIINLYLNLGENNEKAINLRGKLRVFVPEHQNSGTTSKIQSKSILQDECTCSKLPFIPRSVWGSRFNLDSNIYLPPAIYTNVTHLIIHHSAGTNVSNDWAGVVAAYFDYHVNSNGWQDIGYNWLIDPNGVLYEGRGGGDNIQGAHMCGYNRNTMGVCMLGNFEVATPTDTMMTTLIKLLGYKACKEDIDPLGDSEIASFAGHMFNISGHKDGCPPNYTTCPGRFLHEKLDLIRYATDYYIHESCDTVSATFDIVLKPKLFPNPASDYICGIESVISISDINGTLISPTLYKVKDTCADISLLKSGMYYIRTLSQAKIFDTILIKI